MLYDDELDKQIDHVTVIDTALATLTTLERNAIKAIYLDGKTYGGFAKEEGVKRSTIQARVRRGLNKLKKDENLIALFVAYHD